MTYYRSNAYFDAFNIHIYWEANWSDACSSVCCWLRRLLLWMRSIWLIQYMQHESADQADQHAEDQVKGMVVTEEARL